VNQANHGDAEPSTSSQSSGWRQESSTLPGIDISLRITLIDFKPGENREPIDPSNYPSPHRTFIRSP
jgi:hypothetical protein